ncbi:hypothetical protein GVX81_03125 [[Haemophilus] felis]|uniref:Phage tail protein n=1 Tax=[Haemophilus] felis TaxID=123822 RepID=A0A1T0BA32_9PAST|nr:hypothetical protein [[Haemophilus] felis]NBI40338.1 hypothetical protein [[Haemophilus] felis]OOS07070.1 hypothetical protein B0188_01410 [[Haemophilus] felis]
MQIYFKDGFYFDDGYTAIPENAVEISEQTYHRLLEGQVNGKQIYSTENGEPILIDPQPSEYHQLENGQWVLSEENQAKLFAEKKTHLIKKLATKADSFKDALLVGYPQAEIESFYRQEKEALAYSVDPQAQTPMLRQIAEQRGVPFEILVQKVIEKSNQFALAVGVIIGQRQKFEDRILSAENEEQLAEIESEVEQWQMSI